jgi:5-bromo-4-chloroindolyl phosphate hydrolysis protein
MREGKRPSAARPLLAGLIGGGVFAVFLLAAGATPALSAAAGLAGYAAGHLLLGGAPRFMEIDGLRLSSRDVNRVLDQADRGLERLRGYKDRIQSASVREKVARIEKVAGEIVADLRRDPRGIRLARQFLAYYLESTTRILDAYCELSLRPEASDDLRRSLGRVEEILDRILEGFRAQLTRLYRDEVLDLNAEIRVLENTLRFDGVTGARNA